jgi:hypothetical protein
MNRDFHGEVSDVARRWNGFVGKWLRRIWLHAYSSPSRIRGSPRETGNPSINFPGAAANVDPALQIPLENAGYNRAAPPRPAKETSPKFSKELFRHRSLFRTTGVLLPVGAGNTQVPIRRSEKTFRASLA